MEGGREGERKGPEVLEPGAAKIKTLISHKEHFPNKILPKAQVLKQTSPSHTHTSQ